MDARRAGSQPVSRIQRSLDGRLGIHPGEEGNPAHLFFGRLAEILVIHGQEAIREQGFPARHQPVVSGERPRDVVGVIGPVAGCRKTPLENGPCGIFGITPYAHEAGGRQAQPHRAASKL